MTSLGAWQVREEARKCWDHISCDNCVYLAKPPNVDLETAHVLAEKYVRNDLWFHIRWTKAKAGEAGNHYVEILMEAVHFNNACSSPRELDRPVATIDRNRPMFVEVPQFVELPEMMCVYGIRSVVRLKRVEDAVKAGMKQRSLLPVGVIGPTNRKHNLCSGFLINGDGLREQIDQIPSELVERGAEAVNEIAHGKRDLFGRSLWGDCENVLRSIKIVFFDHRIRVGLNPAPELGLGRLEVKVSPSGFHVDVLK